MPRSLSGGRGQLLKLAEAYYTSAYNPPRKAFDFYTASALARFMRSKDLFGLSRLRLFSSGEYGLTLVSQQETWEASLKSYVSRIDTRADPGDSDFVRTKKENFQREISIIRAIGTLPSIEVRACAWSNGWEIVPDIFIACGNKAVNPDTSSMQSCCVMTSKR